MEIYEVEEQTKWGVLIVIMIISGLFTCSCGLLAHSFSKALSLLRQRFLKPRRCLFLVWYNIRYGKSPPHTQDTQVPALKTKPSPGQKLSWTPPHYQVPLAKSADSILNPIISHRHIDQFDTINYVYISLVAIDLLAFFLFENF